MKRAYKFVLFAIVLAALLSYGGGMLWNDETAAAVDRPGSPAVYQRIADMTDCDTLQAEFDQAWESNNRRYQALTPQYEWRRGFMDAADERMHEIGCSS